MFNCMYICTYVIGVVKIILKSIVSHKSKRTGYQICLFLMYEGVSKSSCTNAIRF